jgi:histidine triad (HIT) family protein
MSECVFCDISQHKQTLNHIIAEDDFSVAFLDKNPMAKGHTLVIPKRHVEKLSDLNDNEIKKYFNFISKIQKAVLKFSGEGSGCDILNHYRPYLQEGEMIKRHLHFHVMPRRLNDDLFRKVRIHLTEDEMKKIAVEISNNI